MFYPKANAATSMRTDSAAASSSQALWQEAIFPFRISKEWNSTVAAHHKIIQC